MNYATIFGMFKISFFLRKKYAENLWNSISTMAFCDLSSKTRCLQCRKSFCFNFNLKEKIIIIFQDGLSNLQLPENIHFSLTIYGCIWCISSSRSDIFYCLTIHIEFMKYFEKKITFERFLVFTGLFS